MHESYGAAAGDPMLSAAGGACPLVDSPEAWGESLPHRSLPSPYQRNAVRPKKSLVPLTGIEPV